MVTYLYILELDIGREEQWLNKGLRRPSLLKYLLFRLQRGWGKGQQKSDFAEAVRRSSNKTLRQALSCKFSWNFSRTLKVYLLLRGKTFINKS